MAQRVRLLQEGGLCTTFDASSFLSGSEYLTISQMVKQVMVADGCENMTCVKVTRDSNVVDSSMLVSSLGLAWTLDVVTQKEKPEVLQGSQLLKVDAAKGDVKGNMIGQVGEGNLVMISGSRGAWSKEEKDEVESFLNRPFDWEKCLEDCDGSLQRALTLITSDLSFVSERLGSESLRQGLVDRAVELKRGQSLLKIIPGLEEKYESFKIPAFSSSVVLAWNELVHGHVISFLEKDDRSVEAKLEAPEVRLDLAELKKNPLLLVGKAGSGKSMLCQMLAKKNGARVVAFVDLGEAVANCEELGNKFDLEKLLFQHWNASGMACELGDVEEYLKSKPVIVLDGLDDAYRTGKQKNFLDSLCAGEVDGHHIVMSARIEDASRITAGRWRKLEVVGIKSFDVLAKKYFQTKTDKAKGLIDRINNDLKLKEMAATPLYTQLLCALFDDDDEHLPKSVGELVAGASHLFVCRGICSLKDRGCVERLNEVETIEVFGSLRKISRLSVPSFAETCTKAVEDLIRRSDVLISAGRDRLQRRLFGIRKVEEQLKWYHSVFRDYFVALDAVETANSAIKDGPRDSMVSELQKRLENESDLCWRVAAVLARDLAVFGEICAARVLIQRSEEMVYSGLSRSLEFDGWREACQAVSFSAKVEALLFLGWGEVDRISGRSDAVIFYSQCNVNLLSASMAFACSMGLGMSLLEQAEYQKCYKVLQECESLLIKIIPWLAFLFEDYKTPVFWFELLWMGRRVLISLFVVVINGSDPFQPFFIVLILSTSLAVELHLHPFKDRIENGLEALVLITLLISYGGSYGSEHNGSFAAFQWFVAVLNVGVLCVLLLAVLWPFIMKIREKFRNCQCKCRRRRKNVAKELLPVDAEEK